MSKMMNSISSNKLAFLSSAVAILLTLRMVLLSPESMAVDDSEEKPGKDLVLRGDATCTACHDEDSDSPVLSIGKTRHGTAADARTPTCTSCHGEGNGHRNRVCEIKELTAFLIWIS
jgi:hypothetical protein